MIFFIAVVICTLLIVGLLVTYKRYSSFLKRFYREEWLRLLNEDPFVGGLGAEARWLHGPVAPLISIFNMNEDYKDPKVRRYKKLAVLQLTGVIVCLMLLILLPLLSK
jgi:hypothetical protein